MNNQTQHQVPELRRGFGVLLASTVGMMLGLSAIPFYTLSIFAGPVTEATGWSMSQFQLAFTFKSLGVLSAPIHGYLVDRYDPRKVVLGSIFLFGAAVCLVGPMAGFGIVGYYVAWLLAAILGQSTGPVGWTKFVTSWFDRQRGIALGIVLSGSGFFAFVGPPLLVRAIDNFGWAASYTMLGIAILLISFPVSFLFLKATPAGEAREAKTERKGDLATALKGYRFWLIVVSFSFLGFVIAGLISNLVPMLELRGIARSDAAALAGLVGFSVIAARVIVGMLLDRFWAPAIATISLGLPALSCLALLGTIDLPPVLMVALIGLSAGAEFDILAYLVSRYFPREAYGRIYSVTFMAMAGGAGIAPPVFGANLDWFGNYDTILIVSAIIFAVAPLTLLGLGRTPDPEPAPQAA